MIYRDDHVLVLNKPHGMPVQGGPGITHHLDALLDALRFGSPDRPRLVHRLDRDTSGVLLLARTPGTAAKLAAAFRSRAVEKTYWAVVARRPVPAGRPHRPAAAAHRRRPRRAHRGRRTATTRKPPAPSPTTARSIMPARSWRGWNCRPLTGRTHQLRVHCVAIGAPILGDVKYARPDQNNAFSATVEGLSSELHLHARALRLPHPAGGTLLVEADLPPHIAQTFRTLGFHAPAARPAERR